MDDRRWMTVDGLPPMDYRWWITVDGLPSMDYRRWITLIPINCHRRWNATADELARGRWIAVLPMDCSC
jgi:hypothetical protein